MGDPTQAWRLRLATANLNVSPRICPLGIGTEFGVSTGVAMATGTLYHVVCTYTNNAGIYGNNGGQLAWYLNGALQFTRKSHRYYFIQKSTDLVNWEAWSNPQLENSYSSTNTPTQLTMPEAPGGNQYFRFRVTEP